MNSGRGALEFGVAASSLFCASLMCRSCVAHSGRDRLSSIGLLVCLVGVGLMEGGTARSVRLAASQRRSAFRLLVQQMPNSHPTSSSGFPGVATWELDELLR